MLKLINISKRFKNVKAVSNLSFSTGKGEIYALLGPNGAGKTTTVRMIMKIIRPDSGSIVFDAPIGSERNKMGYLPEERGLYQDSPILKTLIYLAALRGCEQKDAEIRAMDWLERFQIADRKNEKISTLSKGNQQKIQFIASILHDPVLAVLDEPFSGFDPINQEIISDIIKEMKNKGMTILLSAHQMQLVERIADRILMLNNGKELYSGTLDEIKKKTIYDQKIIVSYSDNLNINVLKNSQYIQSFKRTGNEQLEIYYNIDEDSFYNNILSDICRAGIIKSIKTTDVTLHEIFLQSFDKDNDQ